MKIKILQWNIWYQEKIENILNVIKELNPDILCLQEVTKDCGFNKNRDLSKFLKEQTKYFSYEGIAHKFPEGNTQSNVILSKYSLSNGKTVFVNKNTTKGKSNYEQEGRVCISAIANINNKPLTIATTHLSYSDRFVETPRKLKENKLFLNTIKALSHPMIIAGDFNRSPSSELVKELSKTVKNAGPEFTEHTWTTKPFVCGDFKEDKLNWRLDYVFVSPNIQVSSARIIKTKYSDHLPILIEIEI